MNAQAKRSSTAVAVADKNLAPATQEMTSKSGKLVERIAARFSVDPDKMLVTLKDTAFRQRPAKEGRQPVVVTNEHMMMLLVISEQYHLNPFTREIYAFPQEGGIVPIIGYDGWLRLMNEHPKLEYCVDHYAPAETPQEDWYHEVEIKRIDRTRPTTTRKYLKEYYRNTDPWNDMPRHMIEIKTTIQCIRKAFGFAGVFDPDEGERIFAAAKDITPRNEPSTKPKTAVPQARVDAEPAKLPGDLVDAVCSKLQAEGVALSMLLAHFQVGNVEELFADQYEAAIKFIEGESGNG